MLTFIFLAYRGENWHSKLTFLAVLSLFWFTFTISSSILSWVSKSANFFGFFRTRPDLEMSVLPSSSIARLFEVNVMPKTIQKLDFVKFFRQITYYRRNLFTDCTQYWLRFCWGCPRRSTENQIGNCVAGDFCQYWNLLKTPKSQTILDFIFIMSISSRFKINFSFES